MDTSFLAMYSIGLFISGSMGDHYNPKWLLVISYIVVSAVICLISLSGMFSWSSIVLYCILFGINGFMQSFGWPACTVIFANWFGKRGRGAMIGLFCSNANTGNIGGAVLTSFLTSTLLLDWRLSFMIVGLLCAVMAVINGFFLIVHPQEKGILIEEYDEQLNETERLLLEE